MAKLSSRIATFSAVHRGWTWCVVLFLSAIALLGYFDPRFFGRLLDKTARQAEVEAATSSDASGDSEVREIPNVSPISLSNSDAIVVVQCENFFTPRAAEAMRAVVLALEQLEQVSGVLWLDRVPILNIFGLPEPLLPRSTATQAVFDAAKEKSLRHPLVGGQLLSEDTRTQLLMLSLDRSFLFRDEAATTELRKTAEEAAAEFPDVGLTFQVTGRLPASLAAIQAHEKNQFLYQAIGYGMIVFMSIVLFRGIRAVLIVSLAPMMGVFWTLGFIRFLDYYDNPLIDVILPILVSLVGLTDGVHLMVQVRKMRAAGSTAREATRIALEQVGLACFLTSLTTAIGFGSLTLADSVWVRQFGTCCTIGVALTFLAVVTVIPLACSSWLGNKVHVGLERSLIDRNLNKIGGLIHFVLRFKTPIAYLGIAATLILSGFALQLKPDQRQTDGLPMKAEATIAMQHVDKAFKGLGFAEVDIHWSAKVPDGSAEILECVTAVDDIIRAEDSLGRPLSIRSLIDAQPGTGQASERMSLMDLLPPPLKRAFYTPEARTARVTFRVQDLGIAAYGPVFERIEKKLAELQAKNPSFSFELDGESVWRWRNLYQVVVDLASSLGSASVIILAVLAIVYRSVRLGMISVVPNLFPLAFTGAYLYWAGYNLEVVMVCNFTICLGIAVDDTIHFLTRYREELAETNDEDLAIQKAFTGVGTALIMTTAVLVAGFSVVTTSDSRDHHIFAVMGALTISAALFCDLIFLPAMLSLFRSRKEPAAVESLQ